MVRSVGLAPTFQPWHSRVLLLDDDHIEFGAACRCCPDAPCLEGRHACCYINAALKKEMVAGVGSAPTCADLQPAAHLSKPSSVNKIKSGPSAW